MAERREFMHPPRILGAIALALILSLLPAPAPAAAAPRCFPGVPGIGDCIDGDIRTFWERQGGLAVFGYPIGAAYVQPTAAGPITVQLFERARIEHHPMNARPYDIQLGRLGADGLSSRGRGPASPAAPVDGCRFFVATGQSVCGAFLAAWQRYGLDLGQPGISADESLALFGLPLTPARSEQLADGRTLIVQWFERARFEDHGADGVLFGLLGRELADSGAIPRAAAPVSDRGGFIVASGDRLTRQGKPVTIKGINYYPQRRPWLEMWVNWDGLQVERELRLAREQLGINTVRILVPYEMRNQNAFRGRVSPEVLQWLREIVQIAGSLDMRVIVTLFDFYNDFPAPGTREEERDLEYIRTLLGNFIGDDRILAWDIHNEPDHYQAWKDGGSARVLTWLGRMADEIRRIAPNHLVTVGMGQYENLWLPGPDGRRVIDYSDVISLHNYNADDMARQIDEVRRRTNKPILLGEFGWPSGPACLQTGYTEAEQARVYRTALAAARSRVAGVVAWTLRDYEAGPTGRWDTREEHYGLFRSDDTLKPAASELRAFPGEPLPSAVVTQYEITSQPFNRPSGPQAPVLIDAAGYYIKGPFRRAWELFGGQGSFGLPLGEAHVRASDGVVVQYFEAATLELVSEAENTPGYDLLPEPAQIMLKVRVTDLGGAYLGGRQLPPAPGAAEGRIVFRENGKAVAARFEGFYRGVEGRWRLGVALTDEVIEQIDGVPTRVQYFERGRLEYDAASNTVYASRLGVWAYAQQCRATGQ
jgi:hypothetical protein